MKRPPGNRGFTLAEAVVALSLLSIIAGMVYSFYSFAHKQVVVREGRAMEFDNALVLLESVVKNVRGSRGTLSIDRTQWVFITRGGDTAAYVFENGKLRFNSLELTLAGKPPGAFSFDCSGSDSLLDGNNDHDVSFNELDLNGDGKIDGSETAGIAVITAALCTRPGGDTLAAVEAVKNNLEYDGEGAATYF
jgi:prepilin-type N-terminal cleavage/methylation domain-containing protein